MTKKKILALIITAHNVDDKFLVLLENFNQQRLPKNWICHIFIGVDGCDKTKDLLIKNNVEFYFSKKNVGTYIISNSLIDIAKSYDPDIYARFDSDDLPQKNYLFNGIKNCKKIDFVRANFRWKKHPTRNGNNYEPAYGVIFIKSFLFSKIGGYSEYRIEGDNDLIIRLKNLGYEGIVKNIFQKFRFLNRIYYKNLPTFERVYNSNSLSQNKSTGHKTAYRKNIKKILEANRSKSNKVLPKTVNLELIKP